ncbi:hypothetical protein [Actinomadura sp. 6N118]|uniref:hypothetical protein n=1 Tax=Actinomadura sp. 6N118 TaxID=3375151 RepID=UPI003792973A
MAGGRGRVALPRLRQIADRLVDGCAADRAELEAAVLSGFVTAPRHLYVERPQPALERLDLDTGALTVGLQLITRGQWTPLLSAPKTEAGPR